MAKRKGRPPTPGEKQSRLLSVPVKPSDYERFKVIAKARGVTVAEWVRTQLKAAMEDGDDAKSDMSSADRDGIIMSTEQKSSAKQNDPGSRRSKRAAA